MRAWLGIGSVVGAVVASTGLLSGGCSNSSEPYPDISSFCAARAQAECQVAAQCLASMDTCTTARQNACLTAANQITASGKSSYNPSNAQACLGAVQAAYAAPPISASTLSMLDQTCSAIFNGTVSQGGACSQNSDCAQTGAQGSPAQVCAPVQPGSSTTQCTTGNMVTAGAPCGAFGDICAQGSYCLGSKNSPYTCQTGGMSGACSTSPQGKGCATGYFCHVDGSGTSGVCLAGGQPDAACATSQDCGNSAPYCDTNLTPPAGSGTNAKGKCTTGLFSLGSSSEDCMAFGMGM